MKSKAVILTFFIAFMKPLSGVIALQPDKLVVNILEGEVTATWKRPAGAPLISKYNVQMAKLSEEWAAVASCTNITSTSCDLSSFIHDCRAAYKVRVQLVLKGQTSVWSVKKVLPNTGALRPPFFTLSSTSSTLTVSFHERPILKECFPFGLIYTIIMEDVKNENKVTSFWEDKRSQTFTSLQWGKEYCVSAMVEGAGALERSIVSPKQCLLLPKEEWLITAEILVSAVGVLGIIVLMVTMLCCYLRSSAKTPAALKSPVSAWLPLTVGEAPLEVVTDKGWFLSSAREDVKHSIKVPRTHITVKVHGQRASVDSGLDMESNSASDNGEGHSLRQEDSGCGSMGGLESSNCNLLKTPLDNVQRTNRMERRRKDSGESIGFHPNTISTSLEEHERSFRIEIVPQSNYHRQSPSAVQVSASDTRDRLNQTHGDSTLAKVVTGYRAGPQSYICSGAGQCSWCHNRRTREEQQKHICSVSGTLEDKNPIPGYTKNPHIDTIRMEDLEKTFLQSKETFPLLASLSTLPLMKCGQDNNMGNVSLSLCDVKLQID
uniref:Uncharacterized LOC114474786 n=1 Tax=Gouania willdenowi TaxID=441366 RepID=A0A8C5GHQ1_GOUWI